MKSATVRVLIVEDVQGDARLVREMLSETNTGVYEVIHVGRVSEAVPHLRNGDVDVTLLDLSLPDGLGVDTVIQVYAAAPQIPIIVMSGTDDETVIAGAVEEGAQGILDLLAHRFMHSRLLARQRGPRFCYHDIANRIL